MLLCLALIVGCDKEKHASPEAGNKEAANKPGESKASNEVVITAEAVTKYGIKVEPAKKQVLPTTYVVPGEVLFNAEQMSRVGSAVTGRVADLKVKVGALVKKGDELIVIDSPELGAAQSEYIQKRTAVDVAKPAADLAKKAYERGKQIFEEKQGIAFSEVQKREGEYLAAQGNLHAAEGALTGAVNRLQLLGMSDEAIKKLEEGRVDPRFVIRSPIDGTVVERAVSLGELVRPEKEYLVTIADLTTVWILADVVEFRLRELSLGAEAWVKIGDDVPRVRGTVSYLPSQLDTSTRTGQVRIEVKNTDGTLRAGMFVQAEITAGKPDSQGEPVIAVPEDAVQTIDGQTIVFVPVAGKANTFARKTVKVGPSIGDMVPVLAGLKPGEKYVAAGTFTLKAELGKSTLEE